MTVGNASWRWVMAVCTGWLLSLWPLVSNVLAMPASDADTAPLEEVVVTAREPRYVAATQRDRIGRIWAPVYINEQGPFRLVLDTGATHSAVMANVAAALQIEPNLGSRVLLRGATGSAVVPTIRVNSLRAGELLINGKRLPIISDALGGAEGVLGNEGLADKRVHIDFRSDLIVINRSHRERAPEGYITVPVRFAPGRLLTVDARIGSLPVTAVIDTGGQVTIANMATRDALLRRLSKDPTADRIIGATEDVVIGMGYSTPALILGDTLQIRSPHTTFADLEVFKVWNMLDRPAVLVGMDVLGLVDVLIIDYVRAELQIKMRG